MLRKTAWEPRMSLAANTAVEITRGIDSLDIWVDANNNGVRDDDDVNIYITASGGLYTVSPTFKNPLDSDIQSRIRDIGVGILARAGSSDNYMEGKLRELALELVVRAVGDAGTSH